MVLVFSHNDRLGQTILTFIKLTVRFLFLVTLKKIS
jgi:hypothetical protein